MKFVIAFFLLLPIAACSQTAVTSEKKENDQSKLEKFSLKTGSLIKKEYLKVGTIERVEIEIVSITDLIAKSVVKGIKLETSISKSYGSSTSSCFLDEDEIDGFLKSGKLLLQELGAVNVENYVEYQFTSRDGFQSGAFINKSKEWKYFLKLEKFDSDSYVWLDKEDFEKVLNLIEGAKAKL